MPAESSEAILVLDEEYVVLLLRLAEDFIKYTAVIVQAGGY